MQHGERERPWKRAWGIPVTFLAVTAVLLGFASPLVRFPAVLVLLFVLPGLALLEALGYHPEDRVEQLLVGIGLSYVVTAVLTLWVSYLPGLIPGGVLFLACCLAIFVPWFLAQRRGPGRGIPLCSPHSHLPWLALILGVALVLRVVALGYAEFEGDEAKVMMRAAQAIVGQDEALFIHHKGPVEIMIPTATWLLTGRINESLARLPFTLVNLVGLGAVYLLGRRWFGGAVGLVASGLLALNGFLVGFGRFVQYQSVIFALTALALFCFDRYAAEGDNAAQVVGGLLLSGALLAHHEAVVVVPAVAYLYATRIRSRRMHWPREGMVLLATAVVGLGILASFYVPFVQHPAFRQTMQYLTRERVGGGILYNNISPAFLLSTFYNTTYYVVALILSMLMLLPLQLGLLPGVLGLLLLSTTAIWPQRWQVGPVNFSVAPFLLVGLALFRAADAPLRRTLFWFGGSFVFFFFLVEHPYTHIYNVYPPATLLAAVGLREGWRFLKQSPRRVRGGVLLSGILILGLSLAYLGLVFLRPDLEYRRTYPAHRSPLFWTAYDELPCCGFFGMPYQAGWKVIGQLYRQGRLRGDYGSNEEREITDWYTRNAARSFCPRPHYYFIAVNVQDEKPVPWDEIRTEYAPVAVVRVQGQPKLTIYERGAASQEPLVYDAEDFAGDFDRSARPEQWFVPPTLEEYTPVGALLGGQVRLLGYRLDSRSVKPGGTLELVLYWEAVADMEINYKVFVHLETDRIWGGDDSFPNCGVHATADWWPGEVIVDRHFVSVAADTPAGEYPLLVGMYDEETMTRLEARDAAGQRLPGDAVPLATVLVK